MKPPEQAALDERKAIVNSIRRNAKTWRKQLKELDDLVEENYWRALSVQQALPKGMEVIHYHPISTYLDIALSPTHIYDDVVDAANAVAKAFETEVRHIQPYDEKEVKAQLLKDGLTLYFRFHPEGECRVVYEEREVIKTETERVPRIVCRETMEEEGL